MCIPTDPGIARRRGAGRSKPGSSVNARAGWTLIEMMVASFIASIMFLAVAQLTLFTAKSFAALGNYDDLDRYSRNALDVMTKDIRESRSLLSYATNRIVLTNAAATSLTTYTWNPGNASLTRTVTQSSGSYTTLLLTNCDYLYFTMSQRNPSNNFNFYTTTNPTQCKLISVSWSCSRQILAQKVNTESVQTAKIAIRN